MALTGLHYCIIDDVLVAVTLVVLIVRLILYRDAHGHLILPDYFAIGAWVWFAGLAGLHWKLLSLGVFDGKINPRAKGFGPEYGMATEEDTVSALKGYFATAALYYTQMYLAKASMLAFYHRIFPFFLVKLRIALWVTDVFTFLGWLSSLLAKLFACYPVKRNWVLGPANCNVILERMPVLVRWAPHCLTDLVICILPIFLLKHLSLSTFQKFGVAATFASGLLCIIFACLNQITHFWDLPMSVHFLFCTLEPACACIVINLPAMKTLFHRKSSPKRRLSACIRGGGLGQVSIQEIVPVRRRSEAKMTQTSRLPEEPDKTQGLGWEYSSKVGQSHSVDVEKGTVRDMSVFELGSDASGSASSEDVRP